LISLFACSDPGAIALSTCAALPGLSVDPVGLQLLTPLLVPDEVELLRSAEPTQGLELVGAEGLAALRESTTCSVVSVDSAGAGRKAVVLSRRTRAVQADGSLGEPATREFTWQVVDDLVETGLVKAVSLRNSSALAVTEGDLRRAAGTLRTLSKSYPDPLIAVDLAAAEAAFDHAELSEELAHSFVSADGGTVVGALVNGSSRAVTELVAEGVFTTPAGEVVGSATVGDVEAGAEVRYEIAIPDGAEGSVKLRTASFQIASP